MKRVIFTIALVITVTSLVAAGENGAIIVKRNNGRREGLTYPIKIRQNHINETIELYFDDYYDSILDTSEVVNFDNRDKYVDRLAYFDLKYIQSDEDYNRFWTLLYRELFYRNFNRIDPLIEFFTQYGNKRGWSRERMLSEVVSFVQKIEYIRPEHFDIDNRSPINNIGLFTPNQVLFYEKGDCDSKSLLLIMLLKRLGYDAVLLLSKEYQHAIVAINYPGIRGYYKVSNNKRYYTIEATAEWRIGDISKDWSDMSKWTVIRID